MPTINQKTTGPEIRSLSRPVSHREAEGKSTVAGYAAVFGVVAEIGGYFREVLAPGAFAETLKSADVRAYYGHRRDRVLGRSGAGTLRLREDSKGLAVEIDLPDTTDGRDVRTLIERGDIDGMSFGFEVVREEWDFTEEPPVRTIHEVALQEVSVVSEPAYDGTSIALRSLDEARKERPPANFDPALNRLRAKIDLDCTVRPPA